MRPALVTHFISDYAPDASGAKTYLVECCLCGKEAVLSKANPRWVCSCSRVFDYGKISDYTQRHLSIEISHESVYLITCTECHNQGIVGLMAKNQSFECKCGSSGHVHEDGSFLSANFSWRSEEFPAHLYDREEDSVTINA